MNNNIGAFTVGDARHIHKEIFGTRMSQPPMDNTRDKTIHNLLYYALLLEDLTAATNPLTGYTQAQIRVIRYVQPGDGVTLNMEESTTTTGIVQVTNRFESFSASAGDLLLVIRHGSEWSPVNTGSGGGETIWFTITDVLCPETDYVAETTLVATATWYTGGCSKTPPGAEYGGGYYVYDICNYLYGLTPTDLVGTTGRATYHYPLTGTCTPKWIIDDLCAQPEC
jgi:hypothetical protein